MRKLGRLAALVLCLALLVPGAWAEEFTLRDKVDHESAPALQVVAQAMTGDTRDFMGPPPQQVAWDTLANHANALYSTTAYTKEDLTEMFDGLFADGDFEDYLEPKNDQFKLVDGKYAFTPGDGDAATFVAINDVTEDAGVLNVDLSVYKVSDAAGDAFCFNATAQLVPDEAALFGATVRSFQVGAEKQPKPGKISATQELAAQSGNSYAAKNALDGKLSTCWAFDAQKDPEAKLTISFDEPTQLRGLLITPGYAKNQDAYQNNRRVRRLRIDGDDDLAVVFDIEEQASFDGFVAVPFCGVFTVEQLTIRVPESFTGEKFNDLCISEIQLF